MSNVTLGGNPIDVAGRFPQAGDAAPAFKLAGADLAAFRAEKARIDRVIAAGGQRRPAAVQQASTGLRPAES